MQYRVIKPFKHLDARKGEVEALPGSIVDIKTEIDEQRLLQAGRIAPIDLPPMFKDRTPQYGLAPASRRTVRLGLFLYTSPHYSGGRIHLFQMAHAFAHNGGEAFYVSNAMPKWKNDYPDVGIKYVLWDQRQPPEDLDVILTDGKGAAIGRVTKYHEKHPSCKICVMNFETQNWVAEFLPALAKKVSTATRDVFGLADLVVANSRESGRFLEKYVGKPIDRLHVVQPAVNTYALHNSGKVPLVPPIGGRPYAVWSGRGQAYKGHNAAVKAVWSLKTTLDLVSFGNPKEKPKDTPLHHFRCMPQKSDVDKYRMLRGATVTLAPSLFEGFGMVPAESIASGTPVVAYDLPVLREEYAGVKGLYLVPWNNAKAFATKVAAIVNAKNPPKVSSGEVVKRYGMKAMEARVEQLPYCAVKHPRITAQMIVYWGFLPESIEAVYPFVDEIVVAYGPDRNAKKVDDGSLERLRAVPDPDHKITIEVRKKWEDKQNMRQWCHNHSSGNFNMILDGDEIWVGLKDWIASDIYQGCPRWVTFWHDEKHQVVGLPEWKHGRWGSEIKPFGCVCNHYRWSWLRPSFKWMWHCRIEAMTRQPLRNNSPGPAVKVPSAVIYHLGHMLPAALMKLKHSFYCDRDGADKGRIKRANAWQNWKGKLGNCGDGIVKDVTWELPDIVRRAAESAKRIAVR